jgi:excisionase family DNA binding protein
MQASNRPTLRVEGARDYLDVTERQIYDWVRSGKLAHYRVGRELRFSEADLDAFLAERRCEAVTSRRAQNG